MKKVVAFTLLVCILTTLINSFPIANAYASTEPIVSIENLEKDIINISGDANYGEAVSIIVLNPGFSYDDYSGPDRLKRNAALQNMGLTIANENGYSYSFPLKNFDGGVFSVYANGVMTTFEYYGKEIQSSCIEKYNNGDISFEEFISTIGLSNNVIYNALGKTAAQKSIDELKPLDSNVTVTYGNIIEAFLVAAYNNKKEDVLFKNDLICYVNELGLVDKPEYADYLDLLSVAGVKQVKTTLLSGTYKTKQDIVDAFLDSVYVNLMLNYSQHGYGHVYSIYTQYKAAYDKAGISFTKSDGNSLYRKIISIKVTNLKSLKKEIDKIRNNESTTTGGGSSSGSASSSSSKTSSKGFASSGVESYINAEPTIKPTQSVDTEGEEGFADLSSKHWAYPLFKRLIEQNILSGDEKGNINPDNEITRAEFAKMICVMFSVESGNASFTDVSANDWFAPYVCSLAHAGIIKGYEGKFNPNDNIIREDAAVIVSRVLSVYGETECDFIDANEIDDYAKPAVSGLSGMGIINGMPNKSFAPNQNLTRAEAASILANIPENLVLEAKSKSRGDAYFLKSLNVIGAATDALSVVTRGELAKIYYRIMLDTDFVPEYSETPCVYTDVPSNLAAVVNFVSDVGVMGDVGNGSFDADAPLTYIQLLKSMVSFLGYSMQLKTTGGSDADYLRLATELGLVKKSPQNLDGYVTYLSADAIFRYAAAVDIFDKVGEDTYKVIHDVNYLEKYMNILQKQGVVTSDNFFDVDNEKSNVFGRVKVDHNTYDVAETAKDLIYLGGKNVRYMYREEGSNFSPNSDLIIYFEEADNAEVVIDGEDIESIKNHQIRYYDNNRLKVKKFDSSTYIVYNGYALESYTDEMLNPFDEYNGNVRVVDNNNDNIADVINISAYDTMVVGDVRNNYVYSKIRKGQKFSLDDMNGIIINVYGEQVDSADIKSNDILTYEVSPIGEITKINVGIDVGGGVVERIDYDENQDINSIVVSGERYAVAKTVKYDSDFPRFKVGANVVLYFNRDDRVCDFELVEKTDQGMGLITKCIPCEDDDFDNYQIRIFGPNGKFESYKLATKVTINDVRVDANKALSYLSTTEDGSVKRQLITYVVNSDGDISKIGLAGFDGFYEMDGFDGATEHDYTENIKTFGLLASVDSKTIVYVIPDETNRTNESLYSIKSDSIFDDGSTYKLLAYTSKEKGRYIEKAIYVDNKASEGDVDSSKNIFVIDRVQTIYEDGEVVCKVSGAMHANDETTEGELYAETANTLCVGPGKSMVERGDIIQYITDATGRIVKAKLIVDKSEDKLVNSSNPTTPTFPSGGLRFAYGKLYSKTDSLITVELVDNDGTVRYETYPIYRFQTNGITYIYEKKGNGASKFDAQPYDYLYDKETYGDDATSVFVFWSGKWWLSGILFVEND